MQKRSKKEIIAELLMVGNLTQEQIAFQANTKVAYVTKTKSVLIKEGKLPRLVDARQSTKVLLPPSVYHAMNRIQGEMMRRNVDTNTINPNPLSEENVKTLYLALESGLPPPAIIASTGLSPALVESEYERFLRFKGLDIAGLQQRLYILMTSKGFTDSRLEVLKEGKMSCDDLFSLVESFSNFQSNAGLQLSVDNPSSVLPEGWKRIICIRCGLPFEGLIVKPTELIGKAFQNYFTRSIQYCKRCSCDPTSDKFDKYISVYLGEEEVAEKPRAPMSSDKSSSP
jgi:hypothetical protein